ncbi:unnamed protein product [Amoebophrya sp. A120]|nr:unnamed protein product [Amoebophrya sp. A120]|eukprot:GSA120T00016460001.1
MEQRQQCLTLADSSRTTGRRLPVEKNPSSLGRKAMSCFSRLVLLYHVAPGASLLSGVSAFALNGKAHKKSQAGAASSQRSAAAQRGQEIEAARLREEQHKSKCIRHAEAKKLECHADAHGSFDSVVERTTGEQVSSVSSVNEKVKEISNAVKAITQLLVVGDDRDDAGKIGAGARPRGGDEGAPAAAVLWGQEQFLPAMKAAVVYQDEDESESELQRPRFNYLELWKQLGATSLVRPGLGEAVRLVKAARRCVLPRKRFVEEGCTAHVTNATKEHGYADREFVATWQALEEAHAVINVMEGLYIRNAVLPAQQDYLRRKVEAAAYEEKKRQQEELAQLNEERATKELEQAAAAEEQEEIRAVRTKVVQKLSKDEKEVVHWEALIQEIEQERETARDREREEWAQRLLEIQEKAVRGEPICMRDLAPVSGVPDPVERAQQRTQQAQRSADQQRRLRMTRETGMKSGQLERFEQSAEFQSLNQKLEGNVIKWDLGAWLSKGALEAFKSTLFNGEIDDLEGRLNQACRAGGPFAQNLLTGETAGVETILRDTPFGRRVKSGLYTIAAENQHQIVCKAAVKWAVILYDRLAIDIYKANVHFAKKGFAGEQVTAEQAVSYGVYPAWEMRASLRARRSPSPRDEMTAKEEEALERADRVQETLRRKAQLDLTEEQRQVLKTEQIFTFHDTSIKKQRGKTRGAAANQVSKKDISKRFDEAERVVAEAERRLKIREATYQKSWEIWQRQRERSLSKMSMSSEALKTEAEALKTEAEQRGTALAAARYEMRQIKERARFEDAGAPMETLLERYVAGFRDVLHVQGAIKPQVGQEKRDGKENTTQPFAGLLSQWSLPAAEGGPSLRVDKIEAGALLKSLQLKLPKGVELKDLSVLKQFNELVSVQANERTKKVEKVSVYRIPPGIHFPFLASLCLLKHSKYFGVLQVSKQLVLQVLSEEERRFQIRGLLTDPNKNGKLEVLQTLTEEILEGGLVPMLLLTTVVPVPKLRGEAANPSITSSRCPLRRSRSTSPSRRRRSTSPPRSRPGACCRRQRPSNSDRETADPEGQKNNSNCPVQ